MIGDDRNRGEDDRPDALRHRRSSSSRPTAPTSGCGASSSCSPTSCPTSSARCSRRGSGTSRTSCWCRRRRPTSGLSSPATLRRHLRPARRPGRAHAASSAARPEEAHLAVPLVGLDEVIGILLVRSSVTEYTRGAPARAVGGRGEARRLHHDPARDAPSSRSSPASATRRGAPSRLPTRAKDELLELVASSELRHAASARAPATVGLGELKHNPGAGPAARRPARSGPCSRRRSCV